MEGKVTVELTKEELGYIIDALDAFKDDCDGQMGPFSFKSQEECDEDYAKILDLDCKLSKLY